MSRSHSFLSIMSLNLCKYGSDKECAVECGTDRFNEIDLNQLRLLRLRSFYGILTQIIELTI